MARAAVALGSNLPGTRGSREANLWAALKGLAGLGEVIATSSFVETAPVGYVDQPLFLNGAALLETKLPPESLLLALLEIEQGLGRDRSHGIAKGPRTLDLDLLLYDTLVLNTARLVLPHPEMHLRKFVLEPLAEVASGWVHPLLQQTVRQMLDAVQAGVC